MSEEVIGTSKHCILYAGSWIWPYGICYLLLWV